WITGEVSSLNHHRSGLFFTLRDPESPASVRCVIWSSYLDKVVFQPVQGEQLIVLGRIRLYPQRGEYQLMVWQSIQAGEGLLALRYRQLRDRLSAEGLFDPENKQALPSFPKAIAVVTSPQAAAWGDIQRTLKASHPGLQVLLSPSLVQGEQAPPAIVQALKRVEDDGRAEVIILSRGGGSSEDLSCFNDERVVRAIAECKIPIVAGIGHQRDESLADLAADECAHTPTAAAELAVPHLADIQQCHRDRTDRLYWNVRDRLDQARQEHANRCLRLQRIRPDQQLNQEVNHLQTLRQTLIQLTQQRLEAQLQHQTLLHEKLEALDPHSILKRGYAFAQNQEGKAVCSQSQVKIGDRLNLTLASGKLTVQVVESDG
ncbi:MAG: exodeoxyribonuclease VII large subunit, partial [Cyanobacteria bacterium P01_F01_bin.42]